MRFAIRVHVVTIPVICLGKRIRDELIEINETCPTGNTLPCVRTIDYRLHPGMSIGVGKSPHLAGILEP